MKHSFLLRSWPRPLCWLVMAFVTGIAAEHGWPWPLPVAGIGLAAMLLLLLVVVGIFWQNPWLRSPLVPVLLFCALGFLGGRLDRPELPAPAGMEPFFDRQPALYLGKISSPLDFYPDKARLTVQLQAALGEGQSQPPGGGVLLTLGRSLRAPADWFPGERLALRVNLRRFHNFDNPGGYDYVRSQAERGLYARAYAADERFMLKLEEDSRAFPTAFLQKARTNLERFRQKALVWLQRHLPPDEAAFYAGLLLGYQNLLSDPWREHLNRAGVTHLLSISGLHLGLVSLLVFWMGSRLIRLLYPRILHRLPDQRLAVLPALLAAVIYALIAGFGVPPIWRSLIMLAICFAAAYWYLAPDPFSVLAASALIILLVDANSLWQISFQLTFLCMFAIFVLYPKCERFHLTSAHPRLARTRFPGRLLAPFEEAFWLSIAVNIMVLPLTAYYFQGVSVAGFLANVVLVPLTGFLVLAPGLAGLGIFAVHETLAVPLLKVGGFFLGLFEALVVWFSELSWSYFWVGSISLFSLVVFYAGLALVLSPWQGRRKMMGVAILLICSAVAGLAQHARSGPAPSGTLDVVAVDVGQGTATLVRFPGGTTMLVDGGGFYNEAFDLGRAVIGPFLRHSGIRKLDYVVLSHDHPDHRNGLRFVLSHFDVGCFWESGLTEDAQAVSELSEIARKRGIPQKSLGELFGTHTIDGCELSVIHPSPDYLRGKRDRRGLNNMSLVLQIAHGRTSLVLPGDIDETVETGLFQDRKPPEQLLLVSPHHGSAHSNPAWLFDALRPQVVVFSCGADNLFGFPAPIVLAECIERGIPFYRTDLHGAIRAVSNGSRWEIGPAKEPRN